MNIQCYGCIVSITALCVLSACSNPHVGAEATFNNNPKMGYVALSVRCRGGAKESTLYFRKSGVNAIVNHFGFGDDSYTHVNCFDVHQITYSLQYLPVGTYRFIALAQPNLGSRLLDGSFSVVPHQVTYIGRLTINASAVKSVYGPGELHYQFNNKAATDLPHFYKQFPKFTPTLYRTHIGIH